VPGALHDDPPVSRSRERLSRMSVFLVMIVPSAARGRRKDRSIPSAG
jgi:hypothetical protein